MLEMERGPLKSSAKTSFMPSGRRRRTFGDALVPGDTSLVVELEVAIVLHGARARR